LYSPRFFQNVFGWDMDLPSHDGIVCQVKADGLVIDRASEPVALMWSNVSAEAVKQRAWTPAALFGDATQQIPAGEVGVLYVCYREGARADMSDARSDRLVRQLFEWTHDPMIRAPIGFAVRLYPRPVGNGAPDLIESTMRFVSKTYGNETMFAHFPGAVFTRM